MQVYGIPRLDAGAEGIHILWSWPPGLPLSEGGYDIQRLVDDPDRWHAHCETIDSPIINQLRLRAEYLAPLGPLRYRTGAQFTPIKDPKLLSPAIAARPHPDGFGDPQPDAVNAALAQMMAASPLRMSAVGGTYEVFIQELTQPVQRASVQVAGQAAVAVGLCAGKTVTVVDGGSPPAIMQLNAPAIDMLITYVIAPQNLQICVYERITVDSGASWSNAPYVARGLTLPIHEADPTLANPDHEFATAKARLVGNETLVQADFQKLAATLRPPTAATFGRSGERTVLVRSDPSLSYEELPFDIQLSALALHPKTRRVLGFGFADRTGLEAGRSYTYRITGRFPSADLTDTVYDVQRLPAATMLPAAFAIRDLGLRFQMPVKVVLDPLPSSTALQAVSRRGIRIDTTGFDSSWLLPSLDTWSAIINLPSPVSRLILEVAPGHTFTYAAGLPWAFGSPPPQPLPPGPDAEVTFGTPVMELRLAGSGTLFAIRIPSGPSGLGIVQAYSAPITFAPQPLPPPPVVLTAYNFQQAQAIHEGPISESTVVPPRPPPGFMLNWLPPTVSGLGVWPDDLDSGPPLVGLAYQIEHRTVSAASNVRRLGADWWRRQSYLRLARHQLTRRAPGARL